MLLPLSGDTGDTIIQYLMNVFIDTPNGNFSPDTNPTLVLHNGKADIQADKDGWREGLRYIKSLYDEGLIDSSVFTQNADALMKLGDHAGGVILGSATVTHPRDLRHAGAEGRPRPAVRRAASADRPGGEELRDVHLPVGARSDLRPHDQGLADQGLADQADPGDFGPAGKGWFKPGPKDVALDDSLKAKYKRAPTTNGNWNALAQYNNTAQYRNTEAVARDTNSPEGYQRRLFEATKLYEGQHSLDWDLSDGTTTVTVTSDRNQDVTLISRRGITAVTTSAQVAPSTLGPHARSISLTAGQRTRITLGSRIGARH